MKPLDEKALEAGAAVEAEWDGRDFAALGRADKQRYRDRFGDGVRAYMAALDPAPGWMPLPAPDLERVIVAGWQKSKTTTAGGWWWYYEDFTDEKGVPTEHPDALLWVRLQGTLPALPAAPMSQES